MSGDPITYRRLASADLELIREIDRTERIDAIYQQNGPRLDLIDGDRSSPPWTSDGDGEHSVAHQRVECERHLAAGGVALGAFDGDRLVGIGVVTPHIRPSVAQLAFLHVSNGFRGRSIGVHLALELERLALEAGDTEMVVSATPSANTVHFYLGRGFEPMAEPLPELLELEPEDVHLRKDL